jgi:hypothetical protein
MVGRSFLLSVFLIFSASGFSLWGRGPSNDTVKGDGPSLRSEILSLKDMAEFATQTVQANLAHLVNGSGISIVRILEGPQDGYNDEWMSFLENLARMQAVCSACAERMAALKNIALIYRDIFSTCGDIVFSELHSAYIDQTTE